MRVLYGLKNILELTFVSIIVAIVIIILITIYPLFKWTSQILGKFGLISYIPLLTYLLIVIIVAYYFVKLFER